MDRHQAEKICRTLLDCSGKLDRSVATLEGLGSEEFQKRYRRLVGSIMGEFYIEIMRDIYREYPELEPGSIK
jgi:hypothetical protein